MIDFNLRNLTIDKKVINPYVNEELDYDFTAIAVRETDYIFDRFRGLVSVKALDNEGGGVETFIQCQMVVVPSGDAKLVFVDYDRSEEDLPHYVIDDEGHVPDAPIYMDTAEIELRIL